MSRPINLNGIAHLLMGLLASRASGVVLGLVTLLSILWFAGHLFGLESHHRLMIMLAVVAVSLLWLLLRRLRLWRSGEQLTSELAGHNAANQAELDDIRHKMEQALSSLKASHLGAGIRGSAALYALPWYMIIGPSATGKSTLFANSGLHFPYSNSDEVHIQGFGGTRNCDWWFSEQAVLIDTAGRYTSESGDHQEWLAFLSLLQKHRSKLPINGVILALSIADILTADSHGLARQIKQLRERIDELIQQLRIVFPVYITVTKCDLISGFEPFFADLSETERQQLWGVYLLDHHEGELLAPAAAFANKIAGLYQRLCEQRLDKMARETDIHRKRLIFEFPNQFQAAATRLTEFITLLCKQNPYQELPWFVGAYFTSGTQEGTPIEQMGAREDDNFSMVRQPSKQRGITQSYFITNVFRQVLFKLQHLTRGNRRQRQLQRWRKGGSIVCCLVFVCAGLALLMSAYTSNRQLMERGEAIVAAAVEHSKGNAGPLARIKATTRLVEHFQLLSQYRRQPPWYLWLGGFQAGETLAAVEGLLFQQLELMIGQPVQRAVVSRLKSLHRQWFEAGGREQRNLLRHDYYTGLKLYLMMSGHPEKLEPAFAAAVISQYWLPLMGISADNGGVVEQHSTPWQAMIDLYLAGRLPGGTHEGKSAPWGFDRALVTEARSDLMTRPEPPLLYQQLATGQVIEQAPLTLASILSTTNGDLFHSTHGVPYLYTIKGWHEYVKPEIQRIVALATAGDWVMEPDDGREIQRIAQQHSPAMTGALRELYFNDYARHWLTFIEGIKIRPFRSLLQASQALSALSSPKGPLAELMATINHHLLVSDTLLPGHQLTHKPQPIVGADRLVPLPAGTQQQAASSTLIKVVPELDKRFADLRRFSQGADPDKHSDFLQQYLQALGGVHSDITGLAGSSDPAHSAMTFAKALLQGEDAHNGLQAAWIIVDSQLRGLSPESRQALAPLLKSALVASFASAMNIARKQINEEWNNQVYGFYESGLKGKFPFKRQGADAAPADVAELLNRQTGLLWRFVDEQLRPFLRLRKNSWQERRWNGLAIGLDPRLLQSLDRAQQVTRSLFSRNSADAEFDFHVLPVAQPHLKESYLGFGEQQYRYRNEPEEWRKFSWPGSGAVDHARIYGITSGGHRLEVVAEGPWALLRVLTAAKVKWLKGNEYRAIWRMPVTDGDQAGQNVNVMFKLKSGRHSGIFSRQTMSAFSLPVSLFSRFNPQHQVSVLPGDTPAPEGAAVR